MLVRFSAAFTRVYRKLSNDQQDQVDHALRIFRQNPLDPKLRNHKLAGSQKGVRSISAGYDLRMLYVEQDGHTIVMFIDVGTHDEVY